MVNFGLALVAIGIGLYLISVIGASLAERRRRRAHVGTEDTPFEVWKWFWEQLQKPIANLTRGGVQWFKRTVSLGTICLLVGVFFSILGATSGGDDGESPATTTTVA